MSNVADYYAPDETPIERDPTPEEMMPIEEQLLERVRQMRPVIDRQFPDCSSAAAYWTLMNDLEAYLVQAIADRNAPLPCDDVDADFTDPFQGD